MNTVVLEVETELREKPVVETENFPAMNARPVVSTAAELPIVELKLFLTEILYPTMLTL
jgi:hypothetical protein